MNALPTFQCHEQVQACKIRAVVNGPDGWEILPADDALDTFRVPFDYVQRNRPMPGGYYVLHRNGAASYRTALDFEAGYAPVDGLAERRADLLRQLGQINDAIAAAQRSEATT
jgi:hypothetical protein